MMYMHVKKSRICIQAFKIITKIWPNPNKLELKGFFNVIIQKRNERPTLDSIISTIIDRKNIWLHFSNRTKSILQLNHSE